MVIIVNVKLIEALELFVALYTTTSRQILMLHSTFVREKTVGSLYTLGTSYKDHPSEKESARATPGLIIKV